MGRDRKITFIVGGTIRDNLTVMLDAGNTKSYSGSGSVWSDLSGLGNDFTGTNMIADDFYGNDSSSPKSFDFNAIDEEFRRTQEGIPSYSGKYNFTWETWQSARSLSGATYARQAQMDDYVGFSSGVFVRRNQVNGPSAGSPSVGTWQQIIGSGNTTHLSVWLNNNLVGIASHTQAFSGTHISWFVGAQHHAYDTVSTGFNGNISLIRSYARELTKDEINQNYMSAAYRYNATSSNTAPTALILNEYSHVLATKSGNNCSIYINGTISKSFNCQINQNMNGQLFIGARASGVTEFFDGTIDEVQIYNRALTQNEINQLYNDSPHANSETWNCTINATDSSEAVGTPVSTTRTIGSISNFAPTITNIQIKPSPAYENSTLNCSANYNDGDSDKGNITFSWYKDSNLYWQITQLDKSTGEQINEPLTSINTNGLVGYWKFSEGSGTRVRDISSKENIGTLSNFNFNANSGYVSGKYGKALQFDGINDVVNIGNPSPLNTDFTNITVGAWIYSNGTQSTDAALVGKFTVWGFTLHYNTLYFYINNGGNGITTSYSSYHNGWHFITATFSSNNSGGGTMKMYVDGMLKSTRTSNYGSTGSGGNVAIGGSPAGTTPFNGTVDEVMIYNRTLSSGEISIIYNNSPHATGETWNCTINATDSRGIIGNQNSTAITISSTSTIAPTITNVQIKPSPAYDNDVLNCSASYNDADGDKGNVTFSWYNGSTLYWSVTQFNKQNGTVVNEPLTWVDKTGLVGYWKFSEGSGNEAKDISGNNNNGNLVGNTAWNSSGKYGSGLTFDGAGDYVNVTNSPTISVTTNALTLSAWIKLDYNMQAIDIIVDKKGEIWALQGSQQGDGTKIQFDISTAGSQSKLDTNTQFTTKGVWYHIAGTWDGTTMRIYVNGMQENAMNKSGTLATNNNDFVIGGYDTTSGYDFKGGIDEVMIFNRSLSASEITALYSNSPHFSGETWNCTINATDSSETAGAPNSAIITIESVSGYEPKWKHVTVTYSSSRKEKKIYVDNVLVRTEKLSGLSDYKINNQTGNLYISKLYGVPSGNMFNGTIDEMRIYPYALSSSEVNSAYLGSVSYDKLPNQNEATTLLLNGEDVTEMTLAPIVRVSNKEKTCDVTSKVKIPKCA